MILVALGEGMTFAVSFLLLFFFRGVVLIWYTRCARDEKGVPLHHAEPTGVAGEARGACPGSGAQRGEHIHMLACLTFMVVLITSWRVLHFRVTLSAERASIKWRGIKGKKGKREEGKKGKRGEGRKGEAKDIEQNRETWWIFLSY